MHGIFRQQTIRNHHERLLAQFGPILLDASDFIRSDSAKHNETDNAALAWPPISQTSSQAG